MQTAQIQEKIPSSAQPPARAEADLVRLATPVLEMIMQIRAGLLVPSPELRSTLKNHLQKMRAGAEGRDRQALAAMFAVVAFVDETVLLADFPLRAEWMNYPLQLELFQTNVAGIEFYERLSGLLIDAEANADVIEIYYLCLMLGFKGQYYIESDRKGVIDMVADHLRRVGRLRDSQLSPHWQKDDQPQPRVEKPLPIWAKIGLGVWLWILLLLFIVTSFLLSVALSQAKVDLLR